MKLVSGGNFEGYCRLETSLPTQGFSLCFITGSLSGWALMEKDWQDTYDSIREAPGRHRP